MPFAPVKSNPYSSKKPARRVRWVLWPEPVWKSLVEIAQEEHAIGPRTLAIIRDANRRLRAHDAPRSAC